MSSGVKRILNFARGVFLDVIDKEIAALVHGTQHYTGKVGKAEVQHFTMETFDQGPLCRLAVDDAYNTSLSCNMDTGYGGNSRLLLTTQK